MTATIPARVSPLRVVSVIHPFRPAFSGEGEWWLATIPHLRQRGLEVEILTRNGLAAPETEIIEGTTVRRIGLDEAKPYSSWLLGVVDALMKRRRQFDVALFHSPNLDAVYPSCLAGRLMGWKTIYKMTLLGSDDLRTIRETGRCGRARLAALRLADGYISMSRGLTRDFENAPFLRNRLLLVPQGVDTTKYRPVDFAEKRLLRRRFGIPETARVVLFCGCVIHRKGVDILIEAWRFVHERLPGAVLLLAGPNHHEGLEDEPEFRQFSEGIERRVHELGLQSSIRFLGYQREMQPLYAASDLFVLPSRSEGWPSVMAQALSSGLPTVVSHLHGLIEEHLRDGLDASIIRSMDPMAYADAMLRLLTDQTAARKMGEQARARAVERLEMGQVADRYAEFLRSVHGRPAVA